MPPRTDTTRTAYHSTGRLTRWFTDRRAHRQSVERQARTLEVLSREPDWQLDDIGVNRAELVAKLLAYRGIG